MIHFRHGFSGIRLPFLIAASSILSVGGAAILGGEPREMGRDAARERIIKTWDGIDLFAFNASETHLSRKGVETTTKCRFIWGGNGRSAIIVDQVKGQSLYRSLDLRSDGSQNYRTQYFQDGSNKINTIKIQKIGNKQAEYGGWMAMSLWAFIPNGKTIGQNLKDGATLNESGDQDDPLLIMESNFQNRHLSCTLDPDHGALPSKVDMAGESLQISLSVQEFQHMDGYWFPKKGRGHATSIRKGLPSESSFSFNIDEIVVNQPVSDSQFAIPSIPDGVLIEDEVAKTRKSQGGHLARTILLDAHKTAHPISPTKTPIIVPRDAGGISVPATLLVIAGASLLIGLALHFRKNA